MEEFFMNNVQFALIGQFDKKLIKLQNWCEGQALNPTQGTNKVHSREEKHFGYKSNLNSLKPVRGNNHRQSLIMHRITQEFSSEVVDALGKALLPQWNQCTLYRYKAPYEVKGNQVAGGHTQWMCSHSIYFPTQVMICIGECTFHLAQPGKMKKPWEQPEEYSSIQLTPGQVIRFDSKLSHCISPVSANCYHIQFMRFVPGWEKWIPGSDFLLKGGAKCD
jgi:hypothetical protein